jgi:hypothetical protein
LSFPTSPCRRCLALPYCLAPPPPPSPRLAPSPPHLAPSPPRLAPPPPCRFLLLVVVVSALLIVLPLFLLLVSPLFLLLVSPLHLVVVSCSTSLSFPAPPRCRRFLLLSRPYSFSSSRLSSSSLPLLISFSSSGHSSSSSPLLFVYFPSVAIVGMVVEVVVEVVVALSSLRRWMRLCRCWVARSLSLSCGGCGGGDCRGYGVRKVQGGWKKDRGAKTNHDKRRGSWFATHHVGHPTSWVPALSSSLPGSTIE